MGGAAVVKLLLDTHIWIWSVAEPERLSSGVRTELESPDNEIWLSPISVWEFLILVEKGRLIPGMPARLWIAQAMTRLPTREAPLTHDIAHESRVLDLPHEDPADRFLAATAKVLELTLVTADRRLARSRQFAVLSN
jgi:PIN domain nuclease of toxin-antitoxin system